MLITTAQFDDLDGDFDRRFFIIEGGRKTKQIQFQKRWLKEYNWLRYGNSDGNKGGWCMPCVLFLTDSEKSSRGPFVSSPLVNYNKSK